jgi:hypothetical protein
MYSNNKIYTEIPKILVLIFLSLFIFHKNDKIIFIYEF